MEMVASLLIGLVSGAMGGIFGIGGGLVMVPAMVYVLHFAQHKAQGTSLAVLTIPVGFLGAMNYYKAGNVDLRAAGIIAAGFIGGSFLGSKLSLSLPEGTIRKVFAVFLVFVALQMWFKPDKPTPEGQASEQPTQTATSAPDREATE